MAEQSKIRRELLQWLYFSKKWTGYRISKVLKVPRMTVWYNTRAIELGRRKPSKTYCSKPLKEALEERAKKNGYNSHSERARAQEKARESRELNRKFSEIIKKRLDEINRNKAWLAKQTFIDQSHMDKYLKRKVLPKEVYLQRICAKLNLHCNSVDDLVSQYDKIMRK